MDALGIDIGSTNVKVVLVRDDGATLGAAQRPLVWERHGDVAVSVLDNQRARQWLAWSPTVPFDEGVARTWAALRSSLTRGSLL